MTKYHCKICIRDYASRQSLHNHKSKFHNTPETVNKPICNDKKSNLIQTLSKPYPNLIQTLSKPYHFEEQNNTNNTFNNELKCEYCGREYKYYSGKSRHLKKCEEKIMYDELKSSKKLMENKAELQSTLKSLKRQNLMVKKENRKLMKQNKSIVSLTENNTNIQARTNNNIQTQNNTNSNNTNNININNLNIVPLGMEELQNVLNVEEQIEVLNRQYSSLKHLLHKIYYEDKFLKYRNVAIKNLKDKYAYQYNEYNNDFEIVNKSALIFDIISEHTMTIQYFLEYNSDNLTDIVIRRLETFIDTIGDDSSKVYKDNVEAINMLLYNATKRYKIIMNLS
jgi:hypothetical protein